VFLIFFLSLCENQPLYYGQYCDEILKRFPYILEALNSRDTPQRICMSLDICDQASYAVGTPHALEAVPPNATEY